MSNLEEILEAWQQKFFPPWRQYQAGHLSPKHMDEAENRHRLANQAEQIGRLLCQINRLEREKEELRVNLDYWLAQTAENDGLPGHSTDPAGPIHDVKADIERTLDHLLKGRTTKDQRKSLNTATERADRITSEHDAAIGKAIRS